MLKKIHRIENIGKFKKASLHEPIPPSFIVLVYAENGCGKSTLASLLRSLADDDPSIIATRKRLGCEEAPSASLQIDETNYTFQGRKWKPHPKSIKIFDDVFTDENLYSGLAPGWQHRENLHRFIVFGKQSVAFYKRLEEQETKLREAQIRCSIARRFVEEIAARYRMEGAAFREMEKDDENREKIKQWRRKLQMVEARKEIAGQRKFKTISLPTFNLRKIAAFLKNDLQKVRGSSLKSLQRHIESLGNSGEPWLQEGLGHISQPSSKHNPKHCPFCMQEVGDIEVVSLYHEHFNREYRSVQEKARGLVEELEANHGEDKRLLFQSQCLTILQTHDYWSRWITEMPGTIEIPPIAEAWKEALEATLALFRKKLDSPLVAVHLDSSTRAKISRYMKLHAAMKDLSRQLAKNNKLIDSFKLRARKEKLPEIQRVINQLEAQKNRHEGEGKRACTEYERAVKALNKLEAAKEKTVGRFARKVQGTYSKIETSVNKLLESFGTAFQISKAQFTDSPFFAADYQLEIGDAQIGLRSSRVKPSFKTALSTGDRSALSLSFFLSHLYSQPRKSLKNQIVVFDDPMASLDEHRSYETVRQLRYLSSKTKQVIVLSHSKTFLLDLYNEASYALKDEGEDGRRSCSPAYTLTRGEEMASVIEPWDIKTHGMTEVYKRRKLVFEYIKKQDSKRYYEVGASIRLILEDCIASTLAEYQKPGERDSDFAARMMDEGFLSEKAAEELRDIKVYANEFHHNISSGFRRAQNDFELLRFCKRALNFHPRMASGKS